MRFSNANKILAVSLLTLHAHDELLVYHSAWPYWDLLVMTLRSNHVFLSVANLHYAHRLVVNGNTERGKRTKNRIDGLLMAPSCKENSMYRLASTKLAMGRKKGTILSGLTSHV